jgi:hypothetical protein
MLLQVPLNNGVIAYNPKPFFVASLYYWKRMLKTLDNFHLVDSGFTRAFHIHAVFKSDTDQYCFHVKDKNEPDDIDFVPNMGVYDDWESMIQGVATLYSKSWNVFG